jgi:hypothetical protein
MYYQVLSKDNRKVIITDEIIDVDVCLGDYDNIKQKIIYVVEYFIDSERINTSYPLTLDKAKNDGKIFISGINPWKEIE